MLKAKITSNTKIKLSQTLRSWLPILQASAEDLEDEIVKMSQENPCIEIKSQKEESKTIKKNIYSSKKLIIDELNIAKQNIYEELELQLNKTLFPTQKSQEIARIIIDCLNEDGYFVYSKELCKSYTKDEIEKVRKRFCYLEPCGVGAKNYKEAIEFCLLNTNLSDELHKMCIKLINDLENLSNYTKEPLYKEAIAIIKSFNMPPFLENYEDSQQIIPDIYVFNDNGELNVKVNDDFYPEINIEISDRKFYKEEIKKAKNMIDALEMRKATLKKLGLMIIEYQYDYFLGGDIQPMKMQDIAKELDRNTSTISRAIANKYLSSNRGTIALKDFFSIQIDGKASNKAIKNFIKELIEKENNKKPLSDQKILREVEEEFKVKIVRRTITKYRKILNIPSSAERKKIYLLR